MANFPMEINFSFKLSTLCVILTLFSTSNSHDVKKVKLFSNAITEMIRDFYIENSIKFDIVASDIDNWKFAAEVINNIRRSFGTEPVTISYVDVSKLDQINLTRSSIIFVESSDFYTQNEKKIQMKNFDYIKVRHFLVIENLKKFEMDFRVDRSLFVSSIILHNETTKTIRLHQIINECSSDQVLMPAMKLINEFNNLTWRNKTFELNEPMRNLSGCNYFVLCESCIDESTSETLFCLKILEILGESLNFNSTIVYDVNDGAIFEFDLTNLQVLVSTMYLCLRLKNGH